MADTSAGDKTITAYLKRIIGTPVGELIPLTDSDVSIGRTKKSDICINDPNVSRSHCTLNYSTDGWFITDLGGVNGTYLDNDQLMPQIPHPLKDGLGIYLGPPADSPVAFVFIKNKVKEIPKNEEENVPIIKENVPNAEENVPITEENIYITEENVPIQSESVNANNENGSPQRTQPNLKRRAKASSRQSKKHAPSTSRHQPVSSQSTTDGQDSDISINSLDSLRTRIRKMNSHKKKKRSPNARDNNVASTSASPSLRPASSEFECVPSTSAPGQMLTLKLRKTKVAKKGSNLKEISPGVFQELESLFNDGSDSLTETANTGEDSESLLNVENGLPCGAKQASEDVVLEKSLRKKQKKMKRLNEQLQKAHNKLLKENSEQKKKLIKFVEESSSKKEPQENLGEMLEEELICNICTEVFIKATTLGCSHTFCEHCIAEWKKKQKRCPMCREMITSETRILIMDNFIDKVVEKLDKEYQDKRKEVIASREAAKADAAKVKKTKRKKSSRPRPPRRPEIVASPVRTRRDNHEELRQWRLNLLNEVPFHVAESVELLEVDSESDDDAYEPCHFCGELGHNTTNCPRLY